jgi:hypothetical protein
MNGNSDKFVNPLIEFADRISSLPGQFPDNINSILASHDIKLCDTRIELGKKPYWIEWKEYPNHHSFYYDFENNEDRIANYFRNSGLASYQFIIMDFGYQKPLSKIPIDIFIKYWYELVIIAGYEAVVITEDGKLFMEFLRACYYLKSNFPIRTVE